MEFGTADLLVFADAEFGGAADVQEALLAEGLEEAIEEGLGFALFVGRDVGGGPVGEFLEARPAVLGHEKSMHNGRVNTSIIG